MKYKYKILLVTRAGEQTLGAFRKLKDAKFAVSRALEPSRYFIVPCHGPNYYIEYSGNVFLKVITPAY